MRALKEAGVRLGAVARVLASFAVAVLIGAAIAWPFVSPRDPTRIVPAAAAFSLPSLLVATTLAGIFARSNRAGFVALSLLAPFVAGMAYCAFQLAFDFSGRGTDVVQFFALTGWLPGAALALFFTSIAAVIFFARERARVRKRARPAPGDVTERRPS